MFRILIQSILIVGAITTSALAHVVFADPNATPNAYYAGFLRVSHGCGQSPTRAIRVEIPDGINIARPQPKPGWDLDIERAPLAEPIRTEGGAITQRVTAVTWRGELAIDQFDQFGLMMRLPDLSGPLYFRVTQTCATGELRWHDIPAAGATWNSVPHPAPVLNLSGPQTVHEHNH